MPETYRPRIDVRVDDDGPFPSPQVLTGGVRVTVDGTVLTRVTGPDADGDTDERVPGYRGLHVRMDVINLARVAADLLRGDVARHEVRTADVESTPLSLVVEPLSGEHVRLAFRNRHATDDVAVPPGAACGYPVGTAAFCRAVRDAGVGFLATVAELGLDPGHRSLSGLWDLLVAVDHGLA